MHNKVKSEQHFAVTNAKRVSVFQASLNLVQEACVQLSNKCSTSHGSKHLCDVGQCK